MRNVAPNIVSRTRIYVLVLSAAATWFSPVPTRGETGPFGSSFAPLSNRTDRISSVTRDVLLEEGFSPETAPVIVVTEGTNVTVSVDVSNGLARYLSERISQKLAEAEPALRGGRVELRLNGRSIGEAAAPRVTAGPDWRDALTQSQKIVEGPGGLSGSDDLSQTYRVPHPRDIANYTLDPKRRAHAVIYMHLQEIRESGVMYSNITTDDYWSDVFRKCNYPDLFEAGKEEVRRAVAAGMRPYEEGRELSAVLFAQLALDEITRTPSSAGLVTGKLRTGFRRQDTDLSGISRPKN